jgi:Fic family protein
VVSGIHPKPRIHGESAGRAAGEQRSRRRTHDRVVAAVQRFDLGPRRQSIEGYNVSMEDAIAAVEAEEPQDARTEAWLAVAGYRRALTFVLQRAEDPHFRYSEELLKSLHYMMMDFDLTKHPGRWRTGSIFVRNDVTGEMVYEGPPGETVPGLIEELVGSLNMSGRPRR